MKKQIPVFTENYTARLYRNLNDPENFKLYLNKEFPYEEQYPKGGSGIFLDDNFELNPDISDLENSILLYQNLELDETQASDKRLWTYLTHVRFWDYMIKKWSIEGTEKPFGRIKDRYFLNTANIESLSRNGIARLWWYTHLTIDTSRKDHYELTRILLNRQDIAVGIFERRLGSISCIRRGILDYLKDHPSVMKSEDKTRELIKYVNLVGGVKNLSMLRLSEVKMILDKFSTL
jgi:hypothetical protein